MGNLTSKVTKLMLCLSLTSSACAAAAPNHEDALRCTASAIGRASVVRIHDEQKRFFIVRDSADEQLLRPLIEKIGKCLSTDEWNMHWSLSVFKSKELAGYKDDPAIIPFHAGDRWANGYLAEYDAETGILTLRPASSPKTIRISKTDDRR